MHVFIYGVFYEFMYLSYLIIICENYFIRYEVIEIGIRCVLIRLYDEMVKYRMIRPFERNDCKNMFYVLLIT